MNSPIPNLNTSNQAPVNGPGPDSAQFQDNVVTSPAVDTRNRAETISRKQEIQEASETKTSQEIKGLNVLEGLFRIFKQVGKGACLIGGFGCSTAAVVSMFVFNVKTLGLIFGVPAILFFYVAANLGKADKSKKDTGYISDPVKALSNLLENHASSLRDNPAHVIQVIQAVDNIPKNKPEYFDALDRLEALREAILVEKAQLHNLEDEQSMMHEGQMEDYLSVLNNILPAHKQSSSAEVIQEHQDLVRNRIASLHTEPS